jgi:ferredoxin
VSVAERVIAGLTIRIDELLCVGFGDCVGVAPEVFVLNGDGTVDFLDGQVVEPERLVEACRVCPVDALTVVDGSGKQLVPLLP